MAILDEQPLTLTDAGVRSARHPRPRARPGENAASNSSRAIADREYDGLDRSIDVHIWSLRRKLGDDPKNPRFIRTVRAVGYMLINPDAE